MVCYIIYCGFIEKCYLRTVNENENGKRKRESAGRSSPLSCRLDVERGGAKGFAHVGALKAMEELGFGRILYLVRAQELLSRYFMPTAIHPMKS